MMRARVIGTGAHLPARVMTNDDLARIVDTSDAWIVERTGIRERHIAAEGELTSDLASAAARAALVSADLRAAGLDLIVVATVTPGLNYLEKNGLKPVALTAKQADAEIAYMNATLTKAPAAVALVEPKLGSLATFMRDQVKVTDEWNTSLRFTSEVIGDRVVPEIEKLEGKIASVSTAMTAATGGAAAAKGPAGSVGVNLGNLQFQNLDAAFNAYSARYGAGGVGVGMIGGGPAPDFISWARSMGLAQAAPTVNNTFNIVDTESGIARRVSEEVGRTITQGSLVN